MSFKWLMPAEKFLAGQKFSDLDMWNYFLPKGSIPFNVVFALLLAGICHPSSS